MDAAQLKPQTAVDYRRRVCRAMNYISRHLERDLSLDEIAAAAVFSKFHFHRIFRAVVGETVAAFTRRLRLETAAGRLLTRPQEAITTIALSCGFSSSQNFAKSFRRQFGTTPTEFRNRKRGNKDRKGENDISLQTVYPPHTMSGKILGEQRGVAAGANLGMQAEIREMPDDVVAYVRKMGPYGKATSEAAFGELTRWAGPRGLLAGAVTLCVCWDNPEVTPPEKCRLDACLSVPPGTVIDGPVNRQVLDGGPYAVCRFEIDANGFAAAWEAAFDWLIDGGYACADKPCYERYPDATAALPEGRCRVEICIPLEDAP